MESKPRVLIADPVAAEGIAALEKVAVVDVSLGMTPDELIAKIPGYAGLVVRSEARVSRAVIEAGTELVVVGRAGVGVDNIDVEAATERGVMVVNAPQGNTIAAAEHSVALLMAVARHIPQADASLRAGKWERKNFVGTELRGKTLGVVGLGKIGSEVARRAIGLEMIVLGYDPFVLEDRARAIGVTIRPLAEVLAESDFISVHVPLTATNTGLIGAAEIATMKDGVRLINVARGGIIDEADLAEAVASGKVGGAAIDVFTEEPPKPSALLNDPRIIITPHLGASTAEAQERVILDVADQMVDVLGGKPARFAVNAPLLAGETLRVLAPYIETAEMLGRMATQLVSGQVQSIEIDYSGEIAEHDVAPLRASVIRGLMKPISDENVNIVNADLVAHGRGWNIEERLRPVHDAFINLIEVRVVTSEDGISLGGTVEHGQAHVVLIDGLDIDIQPEPHSYLLACGNEDRPGMIGKVGTLLGNFDINVRSMQVGRRGKRERALMLIVLDEAPAESHLREITAIEGVYNVRLVHL